MGDYRLDDLARAADTTVRSIRTYQESGLLPHPRMRGRVGWYDDTHLARLRLIARLQARGFTFAAIADLLQAWESGRDLAEVLGLERPPPAPSEPLTLTREELRSRFHDGLDDDAVVRLVGSGLLERTGGGFRVTSRPAFDAGVTAIARGVPVADVLDLFDALRGHLRSAAASFVELVTERPGPQATPAVLARELTPTARLAVEGWFGLGLAEELAAAGLVEH